MKNRFWICIALVALVTTSCVETSSKYKKLLAERDSVTVQKKALEQGYNEAFNLLNQVEEGFENIRNAQGNFVIKMKSPQKDNYVSQRQLISSEMDYIQTLLQTNRSRINALQKSLNEALANNPAIQSTVDRLQKELAQNQLVMDSLNAIIKTRDLTITDLNRIVKTLNQSVTDMEKNLANAKNNEQYLNQELNELNIVYYCVLPHKQLKAEGILKSNGLFSKLKLSTDPLGENPSVYKKADMRKLPSIPLGTTKYTILTPHPKASYNISEDNQGKLAIFILQSKLFWSKSRILVVSQD